MVSVNLPDLLRDASPLQLTVDAFAATLLAYKLLFPSPAPHEAYAKKHGLTNIKLAKRLPKSHLLVGDAVELSRNLPRLYDWLLEKTLEMGEQPWLQHAPSLPDSIMVATPALIEDVTKTQSNVFDKGDCTRTIFSDIVLRAFFVLDGDAWFHQRQIASKLFSTRMLRDVAAGMFNKHAEDLYAVLEDTCGSQAPVNLSILFHKLTLQVIAELGFGLQMHLVGSKDGHPLDTALEEILPPLFYRVQLPTWIWKLQRFLNTGGERKYRQAADTIHSIVNEMVHKSLTKAQSKTGPDCEPTNIVELYIQTMQDDPTNSNAPPISPETLRDIAVMFVVAGCDPTSDTLGWLFLMLHRHPRVEQKLRKELWDKMPELMHGETKTLTMDQTHSLTYLDAVIKETLRLYPPGSISARQANRDTHLVDGTFVLNEDSSSVWGEDVLEFKPERFIDEGTSELRAVSAFELFSFHAGPRVCIGKHLAMLQMKSMVATLLSRYRLDVLPNDGTYKTALTLVLKNPLPARIHRVDPTVK